MRVLITGCNGQLGRDLQEVFQNEELVLTDLPDLDICDPEKTIAFIGDAKPDLVIHAAAYADVDGCETEPEKAFRVNAAGTRHVAMGSKKCGADLVYISTDYVFNGEKREPYFEYDLPCPLNTYGLSKLAGEKIVISMCPNHYIVRTSWLFGIYGRNFVRTMLRLAEEKQEIKVVDDQTGSPTFSRDLALALREIVKKPYYGIYHVTNSGSCTWRQFAAEILAQSGFRTKVEGIDSSQLNRPARRPAYSVLRNLELKENYGMVLRDYKIALGEMLEKLGKKM